jgi:hypothetical protein
MKIITEFLGAGYFKMSDPIRRFNAVPFTFIFVSLLNVFIGNSHN